MFTSGRAQGFNRKAVAPEFSAASVAAADTAPRRVRPARRMTRASGRFEQGERFLAPGKWQMQALLAPRLLQFEIRRHLLYLLKVPFGNDKDLIE